MTALAEAPLLGQQEPRVKSVPPWDVSLGDQAVAFAAKAGLYLDPWQQMVLREALGVAPGGQWAAPQVGLLVPRQNGKGSVLEALELFHLFVLGTELIIHSAHKFDTSQEHFLRMRILIEGNPDLARHVRATPVAPGKEAIILNNGHRLKFKARTISGSGRGFSSDLLILDEAMVLPEQALDAMLPTLVTRKNPQVWFTSSAGMPESAALWRIVKRGRGKAQRLAYFEWGCEQGINVADRTNWAAANPGLGPRVSLQALEDDFEQMSPEGFAREHLGIWDDVSVGGVFAPGSWESCTDPEAPIAGAPLFGVDVSVDRTTASIGMCGQSQGGPLSLEQWLKVEGESVVKLRGTDWVVPEMARLTTGHGGAAVIDPASPAGSLIDDLRAAGVRVYTVTAREYAQACGWLYDAVKNKEVRHLGQPELDLSVRDARLRDLVGGFAWDRRKPLSDITPLVAVTLACWGFRTYGGDISGAVW